MAGRAARFRMESSSSIPDGPGVGVISITSPGAGRTRADGFHGQSLHGSRLTRESGIGGETGNNSTHRASDVKQLQGLIVSQGRSGRRDWTLDDRAHLAAELLLGLP